MNRENGIFSAYFLRCLPLMFMLNSYQRSCRYQDRVVRFCLKLIYLSFFVALHLQKGTFFVSFFTSVGKGRNDQSVNCYLFMPYDSPFLIVHF